MCSFEFDILKSVSSGIFTGLILATIGWFVWKRQHNYTKKFDVYVKSLANISQIKSLLIEQIRTPLRQLPVETYYQDNKELFVKLESNKFEFGVYFGKIYYEDFDIFSKTMQQLRYFEKDLQRLVANNESQIDILEITEKLYGTKKYNDDINTKLNESFQRIESALKKKKSGKK